MFEPVAGDSGMDYGNPYSHSRTRTVSSNTFPVQPQPQQHQHSPQQQYLSYQQQPHLAQPPNPQFSRRSPSVNTFSTSSSIPPPAAYRNSSHSDLRRSVSIHSQNATSYVALLRKQKATVWCDRAQYEDPRVAEQQRAAKARAAAEVTGGRSRTSLGVSGGRTTTGISATNKVAAKIRHHGKTPVVGFNANDHHVGVGGVPMRLSATEVEAESSEEEDVAASRLHHRRTGSSGRSSTNSGRRGLAYRTSGGRRYSPTDTPERPGSLIEQQQAEAAAGLLDDGSSSRPQSTPSVEDGERADNVGELGSAPRLASNSLMHSVLTREKSVKNPEELKRRGSVDERTATLTSGRLFIANPD